ncbi:ammonium transporter [Gaopeijia maritima]|uniref:ammonium transporter n=1 Tax=Gaopeijia maritima TaxID=3119007 RepID=UPI0038650EC4
MSLRLPLLFGLALIGLALDPTLVLGQDAPVIDSGATAWMLTSTSLVLLMTPGLAMFYGGLVRTRNVLGTMMHAFAAMAIVGVLWAVCGYAMAFGPNVLGGWFGWDSNLVLLGGLENSVVGSDDSLVPEYVFAMFQGKFAIITPALIAGAFAERVKFLGFCVFVALWSLLVYNPLCHWVWAGDGFFYARGAIDFAGGTVVHISSGISALVAALYLGARKGYPGTAMHPNNLTMTLIGAGLLWVGWFGFNAGSAVSSGESSAHALTVTQIAASAGALSWLILEGIRHGKATSLGLASGIIAGLVVITPAADVVTPGGAIVLGALASLVSYGAIQLKTVFGYDDSLDVFGIHGCAGIFGALALTFFIRESWVTANTGEGWSVMSQFGVQAGAVGATLVYAGLATLVLVVLIEKTIGLRMSEDEQGAGMDHALHREHGYGLLNPN